MSDSDKQEFAAEVENAAVEAIGEPGQRRFRLVSRVSGETIVIWMEKQQLDALGEAMDQILIQIGKEDDPFFAADDSPPFDFDTDAQFRVGRFEIGYEEESDRILVVAYDIEAEDDDEPSFMALFPRGLARELSEDASVVVSAGRPRCVLCGLPMGPGGHACAMQNGHLVH